VDCNVFADLVIDDPRVTYVIWNGQIYNRERRKWIKYNGANQHTEHMHVSIDEDAREDSGSWPWSPNFVVTTAIALLRAKRTLRGLFWHVVTTFDRHRRP
jgi:hypothetical protein